MGYSSQPVQCSLVCITADRVLQLMSMIVSANWAVSDRRKSGLINLLDCVWLRWGWEREKQKVRA